MARLQRLGVILQRGAGERLDFLLERVVREFLFPARAGFWRKAFPVLLFLAIAQHGTPAHVEKPRRLGLRVALLHEPDDSFPQIK